MNESGNEIQRGGYQISNQNTTTQCTYDSKNIHRVRVTYTSKDDATNRNQISGKWVHPNEAVGWILFFKTIFM